jgi:ubiquinone/menaquinone biosynthesis C-methylase UbiE
MKVVHKKSSDWTAGDIAAFWNWQSKNTSRQQQYFTATMAPGIVKFIKRKGLLTGNVLDYGCGAGHLLKEMVKEHSVSFYGLDFSAESIKETTKITAGKANLKELVLIDKLPVPFKDAQFDCITLIETIEHLQNDALQATMQELFRILKPGGKIFITTPFNENLSDHLTFCPFCKSEFHFMQHMQTFTVACLTTLATKHGFKVDNCVNIDIERLKFGPAKYFIKQLLIKLAIKAGFKHAKTNKTPNLIAFFVKP